MSTKFGGIPKTQKPPAVCKKGPPPDTIPLPPFIEKIFQGYCNWYDSYGTDRVQITGYTDLIPTPTPGEWDGHIPGSPYSLDIEMFQHGDSEYFTYTITLILGGSSVGAYMRNNVQARSMDPFDSGLIDFIGVGGQLIVQCRIMA